MEDEIPQKCDRTEKLCMFSQVRGAVVAAVLQYQRGMTAEVAMDL
jgi:hypothetical protein